MDSDDVRSTPTATRRSNGMRPFVSPPLRGPAGGARPGGIPQSHRPARPFAPRNGSPENALSGPQSADGNVVPTGIGGSGATSAAPFQNGTVDDLVSPAELPVADATESAARAAQAEPPLELGAASPVGMEPQLDARVTETETASICEPVMKAHESSDSSVAPELGGLEAHSEKRESASDATHVEQDHEPGDSTSPVGEHSGMSVLSPAATTGGTSFDWNPGEVASIEVEGGVEMMPEVTLPSANTPRSNDSWEVLHEEPTILDLGSVAKDGDSVEEVVARSLERVAGRVRSGSLELHKIQLPSDEESALIAALSALRSTLGH